MYSFVTMSRAKQQSFASQSNEFQSYWKGTSRKFHGGIYSKGKRKTKRPLDTKKPLHLVLKSHKAKGRMSFYHPDNKTKVHTIVYKYAERFGIKIFDFSNSGDHLHMSLKIHDRKQFQNFLRTISGLISRLATKAERGVPKGKFWDTLAFTRVADWGRQFKNLRKYIFQNVLEASGAIPYDRKNLKWIPIDSA